jgi:hypothetical protein
MTGAEVGSGRGLFHRVGKLESITGTAKHRDWNRRLLCWSVCISEFKTDGTVRYVMKTAHGRNWKSSLLVLKIVHIFKIFIMGLKSHDFVVYSVEKTPHICHDHFKDEITVIWYMCPEFDNKVQGHTLVTFVPMCSERSVGVIWQLQNEILLCYCECKWNSKWVLWIIILECTSIQSHQKGRMR